MALPCQVFLPGKTVNISCGSTGPGTISGTNNSCSCDFNANYNGQQPTQCGSDPGGSTSCRQYRQTIVGNGCTGTVSGDPSLNCYAYYAKDGCPP